MLGKLMKYEFKATARIFVPLYGALLIVSLITRLMAGLRLETPQVISTVLSLMLIAAAFVVTLILTIQRFYKNLMGSEGYLMHTLPVSADKLIWSKLLVATVWNVVSTAVVFLSIGIMALNNGDFRAFLQSFSQIGFHDFNEIAFALEFIVAVLASVLCGILCMYACMALSMLFNKHRVAIAFAIYVAITTAAQILAAIVVALKSGGLAGIVIDYYPYSETAAYNGAGLFLLNDTVISVHTVMLVLLLIIAAFGAAFFLTTRYMLKNRLNLQ